MLLCKSNNVDALGYDPSECQACTCVYDMCITVESR